MKKISKLLLMGILGLIFIPSVNAASISFEKSTADNNKTKIPVNIEVGEDEQFNQVKIGLCDTGNDSLNCSFEAVTGLLVNNNIFINPNGNFTAGKIKLGYIVLENVGTVKQSNVTLKLDEIVTLDQGTEVSNIEAAQRTGIEIAVKEEEQKTSSDSKLGSLEFNQGTLNTPFSPTTYEYVIYGIQDTISSIKVKDYVCNDGTNCQISISGGNGVVSKTINLARGENKVKIDVTSSDGSQKSTYNFTIYRGETAYNSSKLSSLSFGDYVLTPSFSKDTLEYTMIVPSTVNSVDSIMKYTFEDSGLKSDNLDKNGTDNLVTGENTIKISVTNQAGDDTTVYVIKLTRQSDKGITVLGYINKKVTFFNEDGEKTELDEEQFKKLYSDEWKKIESEEYKFDEEGNLIKETVESNTTDEVKKEEKKKSKLWLIILLIVGGLAVIIIAGILIFRKKPEDKKEQEEINEEEINEEGIEEKIVAEENKDRTVDIDEALSDLLDTKQYDFDDKE